MKKRKFVLQSGDDVMITCAAGTQGLSAEELEEYTDIWCTAVNTTQDMNNSLVKHFYFMTVKY